MIIQEPVQATIWFTLNHYSYKDAIFLAERLNAEIGSEETLYILATCYYRAGKHMSAYSILSNKSFKSSDCRLLLARCCCDLKKYDEAEEAIIGKLSCFETCKSKIVMNIDDLVKDFGKSASFAAQLLALVCSKTERFELAIKYYNASLKINPFLWSSFENLIQLGEKPSSNKIFNISKIVNQHEICIVETRTPQQTGMKGIGNRAPMKKPPARKSIQHQIHAPSTRSNNIHKLFSQSANMNSEFQVPATVTNSPLPPHGHGLRRSSRLFNSSSSVKENSKSTRGNQENNKRPASTIAPASKKIKRQIGTTGSSGTGTIQKEKELNDLNSTKKEKDGTTIRIICDDVKQIGLKINQQQQIQPQQQPPHQQHQRASAEHMLDLIRELGTAALYLGQFHCQKAIKVLMNLPQRHLNTGYVLTSLGRAYFEMGKYEEAVKYFEEAHRVEPHRLQGTEYYSTALWHLQREVKLSVLAQELIEFDKNSPETWCVTGNCFGLQKEHETAIKFLQRAIQVDPEFAYAYTLLGHELVLTEEMDHAMACFRNAIRIDPRHYNAWYGIGMIYYKQEKYQMAELHYRKALEISPWSPVLLCHLGVVQVALKKTDSALQALNRGLEIDPKNALCKFHRASIYFNMDKHNLALEELEELKKIVPKESLVYFLIGKVHKRLGNTYLALRNFSWAMDLDPKGHNNQIKGVIDKQSNDDDEVVFIDTGDEGQSSRNLVDTSESSIRNQSLSESNPSMTDDDDEPRDSVEIMDLAL